MTPDSDGKLVVVAKPNGSFGKHWVEVHVNGRPVVHAGSFDRTRNGETETECGVVISQEIAEKITLRYNTHPALVEALEPFTRSNSSEETITITVKTSDVTRARAALAAARGKERAE